MKKKEYKLEITFSKDLTDKIIMFVPHDLKAYDFPLPVRVSETKKGMK